MERKPLLGGEDGDGPNQYLPYPNPGTGQSLYPPSPAPPYPGMVTYDRGILPGGSPPPQPVSGMPFVPVVADDHVYIADWTHGLCDCHTDIPLSLLTCFFPCLTFGHNASAINDGAGGCATQSAIWCLLESFTALGFLYSCGYRTKLRNKYNLPEEPMPDILVHCCCLPCALCQEYKEIRYRATVRDGGWGTGVLYDAQTAAPNQQAMGSNPY
ncbi:hypothetical protein CBR_g23456 [Chara braunii]|uniref:Uncharacterized protein n=1 Tax=Chara braunii TaxID=69332 RepID=A0A388L496_CHABU|nr:hypothetical protein CBR_g23456 [Chara braunii]|eukprot:GBG77130.1 hypothetical protein CBR_g23456 [Chara braunii]